MKEQITFEEFLDIEKKLEIQVGEIITAERVPKSKKLLKLTVSFSNPNSTTQEEPKTVVTNLGEKLEPEAFIGAKVPFITNLAPATLMGITSEAMIMVAENPDGNIIFNNPSYIAGAKIL